MNKKILTVCSMMAMATAANANSNIPDGKTYMGADLGISKTDYDSAAVDAMAKETLPIMNIYGGYNVNENFALEGGVFASLEKERTLGGESNKTKEYGMYVDAVGKHNLTQDTSLLASAGLQYSKLRVASSSSKVSEKEIAPRFGVGAEHSVTDSTSVRGMARYVFSDYDNAVDNSMQYTVGVNYRF